MSSDKWQGIVDEGKIGGHREHNDHEMVAFNSWGRKEGESVEVPPQTSGWQTLASLGDWLTESHGRQSWRTKMCSKAEHYLRGKSLRHRQSRQAKNLKVNSYKNGQSGLKELVMSK